MAGTSGVAGIASARTPRARRAATGANRSDGYGNAMTGLRAAGLAGDAVLTAGGRPVHRMTTFEDAPPGAAFWYENSSGLAEIAVNRGRADELLGLRVGAAVGIGGA